MTEIDEENDRIRRYMAQYLRDIANDIETCKYLPMRRIGVLFELADGNFGMSHTGHEDRYTKIGLLTVALDHAIKDVGQQVTRADILPLVPYIKQQLKNA